MKAMAWEHGDFAVLGGLRWFHSIKCLPRKMIQFDEYFCNWVEITTEIFLKLFPPWKHHAFQSVDTALPV